MSTIKSSVIDRVNGFVAVRAQDRKNAKAREETKTLLFRDVARMDTAELFAKLKKCTVEEFGKNGRTLKLNPYHVHKTFYTSRYAGLINHSSERLEEQQFTSAMIAAVKFGIGHVFRIPTPELRQAWLEVIGEDETFGIKQVTLQRSILPADYAMKSYLLSRYGQQDETEDDTDTNEVEATDNEDMDPETAEAMKVIFGEIR